MESRRCEECGQVIHDPRASDPKAKHCVHRAKRRVSDNTSEIGPVSADESKSVMKARTDTLGELAAMSDALLARMQTPKARRGMKVAFKASPAELGRAAVKAARKRR